MKITREWAMPNKRTFQIPPIKQLIERETRNYHIILDLFPYPFQIDALEKATMTLDNSVDCVLFDPPYSFHQLNISYNNEGVKLTENYRRDLYNEVARLIKTTGKCISFGWNSNGLGKGRGFEIERILLIAHGGGHNDTICTVERKVQECLE
jgi:hypothetical protein